jgi:hypothetical protein
VWARWKFSPFLFAIYLNDLEQFFVENNVNKGNNKITAYCISASVSERIIVSSAYSNEKSFTNIFKFFEYIFLIFSKSFKLKI